MIHYLTSKAKIHMRTLLLSDTEKYKVVSALGMIEFDNNSNESEKIDILRENEPLDYFNLVNTYSVFLQYVSI
jgi:hypothetical protein